MARLDWYGELAPRAGSQKPLAAVFCSTEFSLMRSNPLKPAYRESLVKLREMESRNKKKSWNLC